MYYIVPAKVTSDLMGRPLEFFLASRWEWTDKERFALKFNRPTDAKAGLKTNGHSGLGISVARS